MLDFRWLNPSKRKALWYGLAWGGITLLFLLWQQWSCMFITLVIAAFYAIVWYSKYERDQRIVNSAPAHTALDRPSAHHELPPARSPEPTMTSKGSSRLFVPPPLTDR